MVDHADATDRVVAIRAIACVERGGKQAGNWQEV